MAEDEKRERAIQLVYSLTLMVEHPNTPPHEAAAAQARIDHLRAKYKLVPTRAKPNTDQVVDELRRQRARTEAANAEWQRIYAQAKARRAAEDAARAKAEADRERTRQAHASDIFDEALRQDGRTRQQKNADMQDQLRGRWNTTTKYHAVIAYAEETTSRTGNPMVTIDFRIGNQTVKGWYVLNNEYGLKALDRVVTTLLGDDARNWPMYRTLAGLRGMTCTVMLDTWEKSGRTEFKVGLVMSRWS